MNPLEKRWLCAAGMVAPSIPVGWLSVAGQMAQQSPEYSHIIAGDNNTFLEKDITDEQILGVMTRVVRDGKSIYMDDPAYMAYVHLWCDAYPARMGILKAGRGAKALLRRAAKLLG